METYNSTPYYDDFDEFKNFHQIMFKPGFAVQARELTQLQTILRDQIQKFGNHIFKHGSVVIPGNSLSDLGVPYVKLETQYNTSNINIQTFLGRTVVGSVSGVKAIVKKVEAATTTEPITFFLSYVSGNTTTGSISFQNSEEIYIEDAVSIRANVVAASSTGVGSLAYINSGVYYINGTFVSVAEQSVVLSKYTSTPSCHVLLKIDETLVDSVENDTLLDNAQGSYNYAAPGADRIKIALTLTTLPLGSDITSDYVEIMRFNQGILQEHAKNAKYSELEKSLARRTFDESGNYIVNGLAPTIREHLKIGNNNGVYTDGDIGKMVIDISAGKGYVNGFEIERIANTKIDVDKARTSSHIKDTTVSLRPNFGQYLIVSNVVGGSAGFTKGLISLYNASSPSDGTATLIGTAKVVGVDYLDAGELQPNMYKLIVSDVTLTGVYGIDDIGGVRYTNGRSAFVLNEYVIPTPAAPFVADETITHASGRTATVKYYNSLTSTVYAYKHSSTMGMPRVGDQVVGSSSGVSATITVRRPIIALGSSGLIFSLPKKIPATLRDPNTNAYNLRYTVQKQLTMTVVAGSGSASISSGSFDAIEEGTFVAIGPTGAIDNGFFTISGNSIIATSCPQNGTVIIYANVTKDDVFPRTKSLQTYTETIVSPGNTITLSKADVVSITSIVDSVGNITANYTLFNGQTDFEYGYGQLTLRPGRSAPTGNIAITYTYYQHSGTGDFLCVDSYSSLTDFLEIPRVYKSTTSNQSYDLINCIDFRPLVTAASSDVIVNDTQFNTTLQYYVPRIDSLVVDAGGKLAILSGTPAETPQPPVIPSGQFELNRFFIPEYTRNVINVVNRRMDVERFTMNDIKKIVNRVERMEDFATLTASELLVTSHNIIDAETGLDRYKTGYVVENFKQPFTLANTTSSDYSISFVNDSMQPPHEPLACKLKLMETSDNYVIKNGFIMLPYTEEVFANQPLSSRVTNLNPFLMISWNGTLDIQPPGDYWVEMVDLPTVYESTTETVEIKVYVDPPPPPTYNIVSNYNIIGEGDTVTFTITTARVPNGTTLYWTITNTVSASDFTDGTLSGSVVINNNTASFTKTIVADALTEGEERFRVQLRKTSTSGPIIADCVEVKIKDTSGNPPIYVSEPPIVINDPSKPVIPVGADPSTVPAGTSYTSSANMITANEGSQIVFTVRAINVPNGTVLYWTSEGTSSASDFDDNATQGTTIVNDSLATVTRSVTMDAITEGAESVRLNVYTDSARTKLATTSDYVSIVDSSKAPTYDVVPTSTTVAEGSTITFNVNTTDVLNGTPLYWSIVGVTGTINASDFVDGLLTGTVSISNNTASFSKAIAADAMSEGTESFQVRLYTDSGRTVLVDTSATVTISDTSTTASSYIVEPSSPFTSGINEGSSVTFTVTTTNVANATVLYWSTESVRGTVNASDFSDSLNQGSVTITSNTGAIVRGIRSDSSTEGFEQFRIKLYSDSGRTTLVASSVPVTINDTSTTPIAVGPIDEPVVEQIQTRTFTNKITTFGGLYGSILGRAGEQKGIDYWVSDLKNGQTIDQVIANFYLQSEYKTLAASGKSPLQLGGSIDKSAITSTTVKEVQVTQEYRNGQWVTISEKPTLQYTTGVDLSGKKFVK